MQIQELIQVRFWVQTFAQVALAMFEEEYFIKKKEILKGLQSSAKREAFWGLLITTNCKI